MKSSFHDLKEWVFIQNVPTSISIPSIRATYLILLASIVLLAFPTLVHSKTSCSPQINALTPDQMCPNPVSPFVGDGGGCKTTHPDWSNYAGFFYVFTTTNSQNCRDIETGGYKDWTFAGGYAQPHVFPITELYPNLRFDEGRFVLLEHKKASNGQWYKAKIIKRDGALEMQVTYEPEYRDPCLPFDVCQVVCKRFSR